MGQANKEKMKEFACEPVDNRMKQIYEKGLNEYAKDIDFDGNI